MYEHNKVKNVDKNGGQTKYCLQTYYGKRHKAKIILHRKVSSLCKTVKLLVKLTAKEMKAKSNDKIVWWIIKSVSNPTEHLICYLIFLTVPQ